MKGNVISFVFMGCVTLFGVLLSGCFSSGYNVRVSSYYSTLPPPGKFFVDSAKSTELNPEYDYYANLVSSDLEFYGFEKVTSAAFAQYKATITYSIEPTSKTYQSSTFSVDDHYYHGWNWPWWSHDRGVSVSEGRLINNYTATVELVLADRSSGKVLLQTQAMTNTTSSLFASVGQCLVDGIFSQFPSPPGRVVSYHLSCD